MAYKTLIRNKKHLKFIRELECVFCASPFVQAAHLRIGTDGGMGLKPSDHWVTPLCHAHHSKQHQIGERTFWKGYDPHTLCRELFLLTGLHDDALAAIERMRDARRRDVSEEAQRCW